jgi:hypothetical protein
VNSAYNITGQHGYSATIDGLDAGTYKVKVFALDTNGGPPQLGSTQTVAVTPGPITVTIGSGTSSFYFLPFIIDHNYSLSQQIYTAAEIGTDGAITSIAFQYAGTASFSMSGVQVYLKHTDKDKFSDYATVPLEEGDKVFEGTFSATGAGWAIITLDTPFEYDGNRNLLVSCFDPTDGSPGTDYTFYVHNADDKTIYREDDYNVPNINSASIERTFWFRSNFRLNILPGVFPKPASLAVVTCSEQTAVLTWAAPETDNAITGYAWQYRKAGDAFWSAEATTTATSATIGGLTADTDYEFRVKTLYGGGASPYATLSFVTAMPLPYECGFENGMDRWGLVDINWGYTGVDADAKHGGENGFEFYPFWNDADKKPQYLISPCFAGDVPMTVLFYYMAYSDTFQVGYSTTTSDVGAFTWGEEITTTCEEVVGEGGVVTFIASWTRYENTFPVGTRYIAVKFIGESGLYLDDFAFLVSGPEPTDLAVGGLTATNAVLTWATPQTDNAITGYA